MEKFTLPIYELNKLQYISVCKGNGSKHFNVFKIDGTFIGTFFTQKECSKKLGLLQSKISKCLLGQAKKHRGHTFKYSENIDER